MRRRKRGRKRRRERGRGRLWSFCCVEAGDGPRPASVLVNSPVRPYFLGGEYSLSWHQYLGVMIPMESNGGSVRFDDFSCDHLYHFIRHKAFLFRFYAYFKLPSVILLVKLKYDEEYQDIDRCQAKEYVPLPGENG